MSIGPDAADRGVMSASEADFLRLVGLDLRDQEHRRLYAVMKAEASDGIRNLDGLHTVSEHRFRSAVRLVYESAGTETKRLYAAYEDAHSTTPGHSWIIRWLMWNALERRRRTQQINGARM